MFQICFFCAGIIKETAFGTTQEGLEKKSAG